MSRFSKPRRARFYPSHLLLNDEEKLALLKEEEIAYEAISRYRECKKEKNQEIASVPTNEKN